MLHVDVHGKFNTKSERMVDLGSVSMGNEWQSDFVDFAEMINSCMTINFNEAFEGCEVDDMPVQMEPNPYLHGYWGDNVHTMTTQASMLGIPTF